MDDIKSFVKQHYWPISAMIFCPCHLPLSMSFLASITAETFLGALISTYYSTIESVLAVAFSFYFLLAFMIWAVRGPQQAKRAACTYDEYGRLQPPGLSTRQIIIWGVIGMLFMPLLITASFFARNDLLSDFVAAAEAIDWTNSGLIWLLSISVVVMIPVMVIWLVWMWVAWTRTDPDQVEQWHYEYE